MNPKSQSRSRNSPGSFLDPSGIDFRPLYIILRRPLCDILNISRFTHRFAKNSKIGKNFRLAVFWNKNEKMWNAFLMITDPSGCRNHWFDYERIFFHHLDFDGIYLFVFSLVHEISEFYFLLYFSWFVLKLERGNDSEQIRQASKFTQRMFFLEVC